MNVMAVGVANRSPACWPGLKILPKALYRVPQCDVEAVWKFMEVVVTGVRRWPGVAACDQTLGPMRNGSDPVKEGVKAVFALSGSGWESNPPGNFSDATMGLKPRTVTRSAYTPGGKDDGRPADKRSQILNSLQRDIALIKSCNPFHDRGYG